jgi:hypothetical protein
VLLSDWDGGRDRLGCDEVVASEFPPSASGLLQQNVLQNCDF